MGEGWGEGASHLSQDTLDVPEHLIVPKPRHSKTSFAEPAIPLGITYECLRVVSTIQFHDKTGLKANKVHNIRTQRLLPFKFKTT